MQIHPVPDCCRVKGHGMFTGLPILFFFIYHSLSYYNLRPGAQGSRSLRPRTLCGCVNRIVDWQQLILIFRQLPHTSELSLWCLLKTRSITDCKCFFSLQLNYWCERHVPITVAEYRFVVIIRAGFSWWGVGPSQRRMRRVQMKRNPGKYFFRANNVKFANMICFSMS